MDLRRGIFGLLIIVVATLATGGCGVKEVPQRREVSLVGRDAPVFEKAYRSLKPEEMDLSRFWLEGSKDDKQKPFPILSDTFRTLAKKVNPAVVNIYTKRLVEKRLTLGVDPREVIPFKLPFPLLDPLLDFIPFKVPIPFSEEGFSLGSGFIINPHGFVLTNQHVIHNALDIMVVLEGGYAQYQAKIVGMDVAADVALLKIEADGPFPAIPLGDSDKVEIGDLVVSVGNPLGLSNTFTSGVVSSKERFIPDQEEEQRASLIDYIQFDAAINPGSSGGPLVNLRGEVVGINTALAARAQLIGFAVPINLVKQIMPMLIRGKVERGWLGISAVPLTAALSSRLKYYKRQGVVISEVAEEGPAAEKGLSKDDIITEIDGKPVNGFRDLLYALWNKPPGAKVRIKFFHKGEYHMVNVTLGRKKA